MKVRVSFSGSDRYDGRVWRVKSGQVYDLPDWLANLYVSRGRAEPVEHASSGPTEAKVVAPDADTSTVPDDTPHDAPDEIPSFAAPSDKDDSGTSYDDAEDDEPSSGDDVEDGAVPLGGGWYQYPDGSKRRGRP